MSKTFDEFDALAGELLDEFEIGQDSGEMPVLKNPAERHPVTGQIIKPEETRAVRGVRASATDFEDVDNIQLGDLLMKFRVLELRGFDVTTKTKISSEGKVYGVLNVEPSGKNIMLTVQARSI